MVVINQRLMKRLIFSGFLAVIALQAAWGQSVFFAEPAVLNDTINSNSEESYPMYSPVDSTLYFVRSLHAQNTGGVRSGQDIWYTKLQPSGEWIEPANNLVNLNNRNNNAVVGISQTGNTLYLLNSYQSEAKEEPGVAFSFGIDQHWRQPNDINVPGLVEKMGEFYGVYIAPSEDIAIVSLQNEDSKGMEDLYVSEKDLETGEWGELVHLGEQINTEGYEISPFLSDDKQTLFFASNGHPGYGNTDIFVSYRQDSSWTNWSNPENLGDDINSAGFDAYLTVSRDSQVFFVSNRYGNSTDIYQSRIISREEREAQMASRIVGDGTGTEIIAEQNRSAEEAELDEETRALLEETQALLDEFKRANSGEQDTYESGSSTATEADFEQKTIYFNINSSELLPASYASLKESIEVLEENSGLYVEVVGHADDSGGKDYNLKLSIERAQSVKKFFMNQGVQESRIITYGKGSTQPITDNVNPEGRKQNRRVVIGFGQ